MGVIGGYSNPFSFLGGKTGGAIATGKQDMLDLDKFDLSSHEDSASSVDYNYYGSLDRGDPLFKSEIVGATTGGFKHQNHQKGERYSTLSMQRSEGEVGCAPEDDISLGEIRIPAAPGDTYTNAKKGIRSTVRGSGSGVTGGSSLNTRVPRVQPGGGSSSVARGPLGETINYEEYKSPEKEDEKPIYESSEGPIQKTRTALAGGRVTGKGDIKPSMIKSGNMVNSFDSFGMTAKRGSGGGIPAGGRGSGHPYLRDTIQDDFLVEHDEDEEDASLRQSAESGEIQPTFKPY